MRITQELTDEALCGELGARLRGWRLSRNITLEQLGEQAGVARQAVARIEAGQGGRVTTLLRVLRALDLLEGLETAVPPVAPSPIQALTHGEHARQRARPKAQAQESSEPWQWGDEE